MERKASSGPQNATELATCAWYLKGGCYLLVGIVGFCWDTTTLIVHTTRFDGPLLVLAFSVLHV